MPLCIQLWYLICILLANRAAVRSINLPVTRSISSTQINKKVSIKERCFVALKPDAVQRSLIGEIIKRFENKGLRLCGIKILQADPRVVAEQYHDLKNATFFNDIINFFTSGPIVATVWEGDNAVALSRKLIGRTHPDQAEPGSIRGDYSVGVGRNLVHASDSILAAKREIDIWFRPHELLDYSKTIEAWMYADASGNGK